MRLRQRDVLLQPSEDLHPSRATIQHRAKTGNGLGRHDGWNPQRGNLAHVDSVKRGRTDSDNRHRVLVHQHLSAHDVLGASELVFSEVVREHHHRTRLSQEPPEGCPLNSAAAALKFGRKTTSAQSMKHYAVKTRYRQRNTYNYRLLGRRPEMYVTLPG